MNQRYFIAYIVSGEAGKYLSGLAQEIAKRFGVSVRTKSPPHLTLKVPFGADTVLVREIEHVLQEFARTHKAASLALRGFGHFLDEVVFVDVALSREAAGLVNELTEVLRTVEGLELSEFDRSRKPHVTLAKRITREQFSEIAEYLETLPKPRFELSLAALALLSKGKEDCEWTVYRRYALQG